jgi:hypothetical protein
MSTTPRTDAAVQLSVAAGHNIVCPNFARQLERENAELRAIIDATLSALPVGNVRTHTPDSIPERVGDLVKAHADELADNEQLRKDKARLDWLADPKNTIGNVTLPTQHIMDHPDSMRAAIDAAMEGDK